MAIKESPSTAPGTHPSLASSLTIVECDGCGREFRIDTCVSGRYEFHGEHMGYRDHDTGIQMDLCRECEVKLFGLDK